MKLAIIMDKDGLRRIAEGGRPYPWDFHCREVQDGGAVTVSEGEHLVHIAEELKIPSRDEALPKAVAALQKDIKDARAACADAVREAEEKISNLLALPAPGEQQ